MPIINPELVVRETFEYESSNYAASREALHWRWMRVYEYLKERNSDDRYEWQEEVAQKYMKRHHIDRMLIHFKY
jgi:hypothetical protein